MNRINGAEYWVKYKGGWWKAVWSEGFWDIWQFEFDWFYDKDFEQIIEKPLNSLTEIDIQFEYKITPL